MGSNTALAEIILPEVTLPENAQPENAPPENASPIPSPGIEETAADLLRRLRLLVEAGKVGIEIDMKRHEHIDSPVIVEADSNRWVYGALLLCAPAFWQGGPLIGFGAAGVCLVLYLIFGRSGIRRKLTRRVHEVALFDIDAWRRLWKFGGITLRASNGQSCAAPGQSWMEFVRTAGE